MSSHVKKMIAPVIITVILVAYLVFFATTLMFNSDIDLIIKVFTGVIPLILTGVSVYVLVERIKEIRSGEEDDLGKY